MSLSRREAAIFARFADTVLAPAPPLPPIRDTDAIASFDGWLARAPRLNRVGARAALLALAVSRADRRLPRLARVERAGGRALVEALRAAAAISYYGDPRVSALLGYDPRAAR